MLCTGFHIYNMYIAKYGPRACLAGHNISPVFKPVTSIVVAMGQAQPQDFIFSVWTPLSARCISGN